MKKPIVHLLVVSVILALALAAAGAPAGIPAAATGRRSLPSPRTAGQRTGLGRARDDGPAPGKRASAAIAITADGRLLLAVNPDSNSLTLVDPAAGRVLTEIPVGVDPRTVAVDEAGMRAYVANRGSDSLSVIDLHTRKVTAEIPLGDRPYGVVVSPDDSRVVVSEQGSDRVSVLDAAALQLVRFYTTADRPSGLAIGDDGKSVYITHLFSGQISILPLERQLILLPLILFDHPSLIQIPCSQAAPGVDGCLQRATGALAAEQPVIAPAPATSISLFPDSNLAQAIVLSPDGRYAFLPHTRSNTTNRALTFDTTVFPLVSIVDLTTSKHLVGQQLDLGTLDPPGVGLPFDADLTPDGKEIWVVNAASNDVSVINLLTRRLAAHIEVGDNPRGIVLAPGGAAAYVNNTLAGTVSVIDTQAYTVTEVITTTEIPLPPALLNGKRLFHSSDDPRVSLNQWIACSTCHFEGEHDGRTWVFGFSGPRNTTGLLGMVETYPLRWSGEWDESADAEFANRKENFGSGLWSGEMNCSLSPPDCAGSHPANAGRSYDLDSLAAFIDSLRLPRNPAHAHGEPLSPAGQRGMALFGDPALACATCHPAPLYTDLLKHDVGTATLDERIGPAYDTPSLRGLYDSAPYFHDGSAATLNAALTRPTPGNEHNLADQLNPDQLHDLIEFLLALPFE